MTVTIRDVAAAAGVSLTTVSHALSNRGRIGEKTRQRVLDVAAELGYRANVHAQQLVTNRSRTLAIQVAPFDSASKSSMLIPNSEYFLEVLNGASDEADRRGYALVLVPPGVGPSTISAFALDGAIIVDPHGDEGLLDPRWTADHPVVTAGRTANRRDPSLIVDNDHRSATVEALNHMWDQGYRRPAAMITDRARSYTRDLVDAYLEWTAERDIAPVVVETGATKSATAAFRDLLADATPADAIYAGSDDIALDVLHEANRMGVRIPADLGLCSCVDSSTFNLTTPEITGVFCHPRTIGGKAVAALIGLLEQGETPRDVTTVPTELIVRRSTLRTAAP
ncbi:LacI family DNA-binding transcriptional regulator [Mycolicibacterium sp. P9-22]|uniref:LacI family DNA-binding transcriptional regulator n=1 Tax=Mycolicibacterium sp. P9-22 TaxID=2024613 RepID=UPI001883C62A|nr:LacI family DNA-binding transcriptional regulator [Mycolicibacterium sp. P9-22]